MNVLWPQCQNDVKRGHKTMGNLIYLLILCKDQLRPTQVLPFQGPSIQAMCIVYGTLRHIVKGIKGL